MKLTSFEFTGFTKQISSPDEKTGERMTYLVFDLASPIPQVVGSRTYWYELEQRRVSNTVTDVKTLRCKLDIIEKYAEEFKFDEDDKGELLMTGKYEGDLILDISNADEVWLTDTKFSTMSRDWKASKQVEKIGKLLQRANLQAVK